MLARISLVTGLLTCLSLAAPTLVEADTRVIIGAPSVGIYAPPLSIQIGPQPIYSPYYYYPPPPPLYYPGPAYYYGPRYYYPPAYRYHRDYYRNYYYRDHDHDHGHGDDHDRRH